MVSPTISRTSEGGPRWPVPQYWFWLPAGFDPRNFLPRELGIYGDEARYLVSTIVSKAAIGDVDDDGFARLHSDVLRRIVTARPWSKILGALRHKVIETAPYRAGHYSRGYRLAPDWANRKHCRQRATDPHFLLRIQTERDRMEKEEIAKWKPIHYQLGLSQQDLTITDDADLILADLIDHARLCQDVLVARIRTGDFRFKVSSTGRCFNNITGTKKCLRPSLRIGDEPLGSIDLRCAQPALLALLIMATNPSIGWSKRTTYIPCSGLDPILRSCPSYDEVSCASVDSCELDRYRLAAVGGTLYDDLLAVVGGIDRDELKRLVLRDVLAKRGCYPPSVVEEAFRSLFPGVFRFIRTVNSKANATLIRLLQQLEAWLVIDLVAPRLIEKVPIVTLHDAIYAPVSALDEVENAFRGVFEELDFSISLKREGEVPAVPVCNAYMQLPNANDDPAFRLAA